MHGAAANHAPVALRLCANVAPQGCQLLLLPLGLGFRICRRAAAARQLGNAIQQGCGVAGEGEGGAGVVWCGVKTRKRGRQHCVGGAGSSQHCACSSHRPAAAAICLPAVRCTLYTHKTHCHYQHTPAPAPTLHPLLVAPQLRLRRLQALLSICQVAVVLRQLAIAPRQVICRQTRRQEGGQACRGSVDLQEQRHNNWQTAGRQK